ncbi:hypothetical protein M0812_09916 [Anaeramoeba flamelloides]|uniref:SEC7 domain-containing protein n=1 Tax=Anaeramoeba flamelloides TaxID=1746091 RepID=A0AAV7ZSI7_9EUKA|nr:hypothetical protein M0812_09916 [Anaeramoeba flamelloides]
MTESTLFSSLKPYFETIKKESNTIKKLELANEESEIDSKQLTLIFFNSIKNALDSHSHKILVAAIHSTLLLIEWEKFDISITTSNENEGYVADELIESLNTCLTSVNEQVEELLIKTFSAIVKFKSKHLHGTRFLNCTNYIFETCTNSENKKSLKLGHEIFLEIIDNYLKSTKKKTQKKKSKSSFSEFANEYEKDLSILLRLLFEKSSITLDSKVKENSQAYKAYHHKIDLSLELILHLLNEGGTFSKNSYQIFGSILKQNLNQTLLEKGKSHDNKLFEKIHLIFRKIYHNYRNLLIEEIGLFLYEDIICLIENEKYNFTQMLISLQTFFLIFNNPNTLLEFYIAYNQFNKQNPISNLFEKSVKCISKITKGEILFSKVNSSDKDYSLFNYTKLRRFALKILISCLRSMFIWSGNLFNEDPFLNVKKIIKSQKKNLIISKNASNQSIIKKGKPKKLEINKKDSDSHSNSDPNTNSNTDSDSDSDDNSNKNSDSNDDDDELEEFKIDKEDENENENEEARLITQISNEKFRKGLEYLIKIINQNLKENINEEKDQITIQKENKNEKQKENKKRQKERGKQKDIKQKKQLKNLSELLIQSKENKFTLLKIGDFLSSEGELNEILLDYWFEQLDFTKLNLIVALKKMFQDFLLPKDQSKIERILEKFSEKYCQNNYNIFKSSKLVYLLCNQILHLFSNLKNKYLVKKITKNEFIKNNRDLSSIEKNLSEEFLGEIYDQILLMANENNINKIKNVKFVNENDNLMSSNNSIQIEKEKEEEIEKEKEKEKEKENSDEEIYKSIILTEESQRYFLTIDEKYLIYTKKSKKKIEKYTKVNDYNSQKKLQFLTIQIKFILKRIWNDILDSIFSILKETQDLRIIDYCTRGLRASIKLLGLFNFDEEREIFIKKYLSLISDIEPNREINEKQYDILKSLILLTTIEGNYLGTSWEIILKEYVKLIKCKIIFSKILMDLTGDNVKEFKIIDSSNKLKVVEPLYIDNIISNSNKLQISQLIKFIQSLVSISSIEIEENEKKKQNYIESVKKNKNNKNKKKKGVEIKEEDYNYHYLIYLFETLNNNLERKKVDWYTIWALVSPYLRQIGRKENDDLLNIYLTNLEKLTIKAVQKNELQNFNFQQDFFSCYLSLLKEQKNIVILKACLNSLQKIIRNENKNLKSGIKPILKILTFASNFSKFAIKWRNLLIKNMSFQILINIATNYLETFKYTLIDIINLLIFFIENNLFNTQFNNSNKKKSMGEKHGNNTNSNMQKIENENIFDNDEMKIKAIESIYTISEYLLLNEQKIVIGENQIQEQIIYTYWFPILYGLSKVITSIDIHSKKGQVKIKKFANKTLFQILANVGEKIDITSWKLIFKTVILPIFDDVCIQQEDLQNEENKLNLYSEFFETMINLLILFYQKITFHLIPKFLDFLQSLINENRHFFFKIVPFIGKFIGETIHSFTPQIAKQFIIHILKFLKLTNPQQFIGNFEIEKNINQINNSSGTSDNENKEKMKKDYPLTLLSKIFHQQTKIYFQQTKQITNKMIKSKQIIELNSKLHLHLLKIFFHLFKKLLNIIQIDEIILMLNQMKLSFLFPYEFNQSLKLRLQLFKFNFSQDEQLPNFIDLEIYTKMEYLNCLLLLSNSKKEENQLIVENQLIEVMGHFISCYILEQSNPKIGQIQMLLTNENKNTIKVVNDILKFESEKINLNYSNFVMAILEQLQQFDNNKLNQFLKSGGYLQLSKLILSETKEIRQQVFNIFTKIGEIYKITSQEKL